MKKNLILNKLPSYISLDPETAKRDETSPSAHFLLGIQEAIRHKVSRVIEDPEHHIYNFFGTGHFVSELQNAYNRLQSSEELKLQASAISNIYKSSVWGEFDFWSGAPLHWIAYRVGYRVMTGLYAITLVTDDWKYHNNFYDWFNRSWLPRADAAALVYGQTKRAVTRLQPIAYLLLPPMDAIRDKLIDLNNEIRTEHTEICCWLSDVSHKDFIHAIH